MIRLIAADMDGTLLTTDKRLWAGPYLFKGTYSVAAGMSCAGTLTRWFRENMAADVAAKCEADGSNVYAEMMKMADETLEQFYKDAENPLGTKQPY